MKVPSVVGSLATRSLPRLPLPRPPPPAALGSVTARGALYRARALAGTPQEGSPVASSSSRRGDGGPTPLAPPPPPLATSWNDEVWSSPVALSSRVFCNRSLNMRSITAVGFDMDYTLAQYRPETFEELAYKQACGKLVRLLGYPQEVLSFEYDCHYMVRGLAVDKARGNVLKMDRHKYVKLAYHGFAELTREARLATYSDGAKREAFDEPAYALLDTLFSLGETYLFCQLVELKDARPELFPEHKSYAAMHADVRQAVDMCHRDGSLKRVVAADPGKFIYPDPALVPLLELLRASGRKVFLVTNSLWDYTHVVMNFLCEGRVGADKTLDWVKRFDVVITGSAKPKFFENEREPIFEVDPSTGNLLNTDNGAPLPHVGGADPLSVLDPRFTPGAPQVVPPGAGTGAAGEGLETGSEGAAARGMGTIFQGGCYRHLHAMLGVSTGSQVLYVGDHIYGDILRSKKTLGWRTALVVPELAAELRVREATRGAAQEFRALRQRRDALDDELQRLEWAAKSSSLRSAGAAITVAGPAGEELAPRIVALRAERDALRELHRDSLRRYHGSFHSVWGQLMKTGYATSRFASQVERFACLYTSHVANLLSYSPDKTFRGGEDSLPHEQGSD